MARFSSAGEPAARAAQAPKASSTNFMVLQVTGKQRYSEG